MAVPKRHLKRAVDRNALKRVAREAWRLAPWGDCPVPQVVMVKLRRSEPDWKSTSRPALKKAWRAELDELFLRLRRRIPALPAPITPAADAPQSVVSALNTLQSVPAGTGRNHHDV